MIESLWSCLLILACLNRATRPLAFLLTAKWGLNYASAWSGIWTLPALIDVAFGSVGVLMAMRLPPRIGAVMIASFVFVPLVHALHWGLWVNDVYVGVQYWLVMLGLFSAQVLALAVPEVQDIARAVRSNRRIARRRAVVGLPSARGWKGTARPRG